MRLLGIDGLGCILGGLGIAEVFGMCTREVLLVRMVKRAYSSSEVP